MIVTVNPSQKTPLAEYYLDSQDVCDNAIKNLHNSQRRWKQMPVHHRAQYLINLSRLLQNERDDLAEQIALEMGKPIQQGLSEIEKCIWLCRYFAEHGPKELEERYVSTGFRHAWLAPTPLGIIYGIMPWNYPLWQVFRFMVPTLLMGNAVLIKHALNVTGTAKKLQKICQEAHPDHVVDFIFVDNQSALKIIDHHDISAVSFTGSSDAGRLIAAKSGENLKKSVLELGGSDPYFVLEDADIIVSAQKCAYSRLQNSGQSCIAAKRFYLHKSISECFMGHFKNEFSK